MKDDKYYLDLLLFARDAIGSYYAVAAAIGAPSGAAVEAWRRNGVAHRWRPALERVYGAQFRRQRKKND